MGKYELHPMTTSAHTINIVVNGEPKLLADGATVASLVEGLGIKPRYVAVEVNLQLVSRDKHTQHQLHEGDRLEVVTLVGGG